MSGNIVATPSVGSTDWSSWITKTDKNWRGYIAVSLSNFDSSSAPLLEGGSLVEVDGSVYEFSTNESIGGSTSTGDLYIKIVGTSSVATAEYTSTTPSWSAAKQGWYSTGDDRYIGGATRTTGGDIIKKYLLDSHVINFKRYGDGMMSADGIAAHSYHASSAIEDNVYDAVSPYLPNVGDSIVMNGSIYRSGTPNNFLVVSYVSRESSTQIRFYGINRVTDGLSSIVIVSGDTDSVEVASLSW